MEIPKLQAAGQAFRTKQKPNVKPGWARDTAMYRGEFRSVLHLSIKAL